MQVLLKAFDKKRLFIILAHGRRKGGMREPCPPPDFEIFSKKRLFSYFQVGKNKFHHFWPPWKNF